MNKNHRVIWSTIRNCFVVASEVAKAKGKPSSSRKTVAAAIAALFIAPGVASAAACGNETNISGAVGAQCYTDQNVIINNTGSITAGPAITATAAYISAAPYSSNFTNNGTIRVEASANGSSGTNAYAYGVYVNGAVAGAINNTGLIDVHIPTANSTAYAYGIYANGNVDGTITNSGTIKLDVTAYTDPEAYGIYVNGNVTGSVVNSGTIDIKEVSTDSDLYAYGIYVSGNVTGSVTNSGTIKLDLNPESYIYTGAGIYVSGSLGAAATINNTGTITVNAHTDTGYDSEAYGIYVGGDADGTISNSKTINISSTALSDASAYGVYISGNLNGKLTNSGTINAVADAYYYYADAFGINVEGSMGEGASITNSGVITANAYASSDDAYAYGISVGSLFESASIANTGTINASADAYYRASAYGINVDNVGEDVYGEDANATYITNTGTITASASGDYSVNAYGVYIGSAYGSSGTVLDNSGTISATVNAAGEDVAAYGVKINYDSGEDTSRTLINNSGTISANNENAYGEDRVYGVHLGNLNSTVLNSGIISATSANEYANNYQATSIYVGEGGGGTIFNLAGGELQGRVELNGANLENDGLLNTRLGDSRIWGGDYTQGATGILEIGALSTGRYGSLQQAYGTTTLEDGATIRVNLNPEHTILAGETLASVIRNTSNLIDVQGAINVQDNSLALNFTAETFDSGEDAGNQIDLTAAATGMSTVVAAVTGAGLGSGAGAGGVLAGWHAGKSGSVQPGSQGFPLRAG